MITANFAHLYNREPFAYTGDLENSLHQCSYQLIRSQKAKLITRAEDLIKAIGWESKSIGTAVQKQLFIQLTEEEKIIFDCLKLVANESLENIAIATGFSVSKTATVLLKLEMKGCDKPLPGKFYEWV